jgi:hypothetical protein
MFLPHLACPSVWSVVKPSIALAFCGYCTLANGESLRILSAQRDAMTSVLRTILVIATVGIMTANMAVAASDDDAGGPCHRN